MEKFFKNNIEQISTSCPDNRKEETRGEKKYVQIPEDKPDNANIDFDKLLLELRELENEPGMSVRDINRYEMIMHENGEKEEELLNKIIDTAQKRGINTEQFKILNEVLALDIIKKSNSEGNMRSYNPATGKILINSGDIQNLAPAHINHCLIWRGESPEVSLVHHEKIHQYQHLTPLGEGANVIREILRGLFIDDIKKYKQAKEVIKELGWASIISLAFYGAGPAGILLVFARGYDRIIKRKKNQDILKEAQAYTGYIGYDEMAPATTSDLEKILSREPYKLIKSKKDVDKLITSVLAVKRLYALGLSDKEIGILVKGAKWDEKRIGYDLLEDKISELANERGLDMDDLDNLMLARDLNRKIDTYKIMFIAQEELKKIAEKIIVL